MRYLNKIVFINSAHVPYAEIKLDGNVHFIGTQGVGKSTLLRAILFFYNVDKGKLGIRTQDKQKSYDEFYFPYPNSYIIYEVCRETGIFFVMTFLSRGRAAFRIVDCPYDRRFFVEEDGSVRYEWGRISEQIGTRVFKSNIIRGYEEFRDIAKSDEDVLSLALFPQVAPKFLAWRDDPHEASVSPKPSAPSDADTVRELYVEYQP